MSEAIKLPYKRDNHMAHEVERNADGSYSAFFNNNLPAWWNGGVVLNNKDLTPREAWEMAYPGILMDAQLRPEIAGQPSKDISPKTKAIMRVMPDGEVRHISDVGIDYTYPQPHECFSFFEPYLDQGCTLEAGGSLMSGTRMWALAKLPNGTLDVAQSDALNGYLLVYTAFDGSLSHGIKFTGTRVVCQNTLNMAMNGGGQEIKFRHTKNIMTKIEAVKADIDITMKGFRNTVDYYRSLAKRKMNGKQMADYIMTLFAADYMEGGKLADKEIPAQTKNKVTRVIQLIDEQRNLDLVPAIRGTAWQAYNAVSEYLTHEHGRSQDTRLNSMWFGESAKLNKQAAELAGVI